MASASGTGRHYTRNREVFPRRRGHHGNLGPVRAPDAAASIHEGFRLQWTWWAVPEARQARPEVMPPAAWDASP